MRDRAEQGLQSTPRPIQLRSRATSLRSKIDTIIWNYFPVSPLCATSLFLDDMDHIWASTQKEQPSGRRHCKGLLS